MDLVCGRTESSLAPCFVWTVTLNLLEPNSLRRPACNRSLKTFCAGYRLRRTCAKLCRKNGGDLEQIKFLLGHASIQTTERYLGSEQEIAVAVNDNLGL
jgi:integrase